MTIGTVVDIARESLLERIAELEAALEAANARIAAEREACAKLAAFYSAHDDEPENDPAYRIAAAIRARGSK
jgi:hypothetical protein